MKNVTSVFTKKEVKDVPMLTYSLLFAILLLIGGRYVFLYRRKKSGLNQAAIDRRLLQKLNDESETCEQKTGHSIQKK